MAAFLGPPKGMRADGDLLRQAPDAHCHLLIDDTYRHDAGHAV